MIGAENVSAGTATILAYPLQVARSEPEAIKGDIDIAAVGAVLGDRARARMLLALGDGRALPASMLASEAGIAASTASEHLYRLVEAGFVAAEKRGRYRYYSLSGPPVSDLIEAAARLAPSQPVRSLREGTRAHAVRFARSCYDHLAGRLGVAVTTAFIAEGGLEGGADSAAYALTPLGRKRFEELEAEVPASSSVRCCVDWTEQQHHMAGPHGRALLSRLLDLDWVRRDQSSRALRVTASGKSGLGDWLGPTLDLTLD